MASYEIRLVEQMNQYESGDQIHDLPDIFHVWSEKHLQPKMNKVLGCSKVVDFYVNSIVDVFSSTNAPRSLISIGSGDCALEISIATDLISKGYCDFAIDCLEVSDNLISTGRSRIEHLGLSKYFNLMTVDINKWNPSPEKKYGIAIANHSLHHIIELESLFESIFNLLDYRGSFLTNDMIGRNGHMRWPEVLEFVDALWRLLGPEKKFNHQLKQQHDTYVNFDCSNHGFEGIRSQDILSILIRKFYFSKFLAFGGLTEVFFDRGYGNNFSKNSELDLAFMDLVELLNERLIDGGLIKPTMMFAELKKTACVTSFYRNWHPEFCLRKP